MPPDRLSDERLGGVTVQLQINGEVRELPDGASVTQVLSVFGLGEDRVAVEHNGRIVERAQYGVTVLREADALEIVRFVGGG